MFAKHTMYLRTAACLAGLSNWEPVGALRFRRAKVFPSDVEQGDLPEQNQVPPKPLGKPSSSGHKSVEAWVNSPDTMHQSPPPQLIKCSQVASAESYEQKLRQEEEERQRIAEQKELLMKNFAELV